MKVLKILMYAIFATLIVGALTGCGGGGGGGGGDMTGGGGSGGGGYDTSEFRKIQFWTYEECYQKKVLIESKDLARALDQGYFDNWGEPWFGGVWDSPFPGTTSDLLPAGNYNMCYERKCSGEWKHRYFGLNVPGGWDGQLPDVIEVGNAANWQSDASGGCPVGIGGVGSGGGGDIPPEMTAVVYIKNIGTYPISEAYISPSSSDSWGNNLIPEGKALPPGEQMPNTINNCNLNYDFKVIHYVNGGIPQESFGNYVECGKVYTWGVGYGTEGITRDNLSNNPKNNGKQIQ